MDGSVNSIIHSSPTDWDEFRPKSDHSYKMLVVALPVRRPALQDILILVCA